MPDKGVFRQLEYVKRVLTACWRARLCRIIDEPQYLKHSLSIDVVLTTEPEVLNLNKNKYLLCIFLMCLCANGAAQTDDQEENEDKLGPFLLDLSVTRIDTVEGIAEVFLPGFTWLARPDIRVGASTSFVSFDPSEETELELGKGDSYHGIGDSILFLQYDWQERLTASPWIPDKLGTTVSLLIPTGNAKKFLGEDTWAASISGSRPVTIESKWLINPFIAYNFSFNEGPSALHWNIGEVGLGIVRLFPSSFWIGYTPTLWYDFSNDNWNFDGHITVGKMFSNGMGIGLDYGVTERHFWLEGRNDRNFLVNFYYQFKK